MTKTFLKFIDAPEYRHVLGLSGGKDSAALAIYIKENYPALHKKVEYFFTDTGSELTEVYDFLDKLESYLGKEINKLSSGKPFDHWLTKHHGYLPSPQQRWCTRVMKIEPFEAFVGDDSVISYVGIHADEKREGYVSSKPTIKAVFPFMEDNIIRDDVFQILENTVGIPEYYQWRSRSGCFFCFFQRHDEWLGLKRNHPVLFEKALEIEQRIRERYKWGEGLVTIDEEKTYTWSSQGPLEEIIKRAEKREKEHLNKSLKKSERWQDVLRYDNEDDDPEDQACLICSL